MKKLILIILSVMAFTGLSLAQDVYYSGYYTNSSGNNVAAVYKNGTKLYENSEGVNCQSTCVLFRGDGYNTVFWSACTFNSDGSYYYADIWKNNSRWLNSPVTEYRHITDMCLDRGYADVYAVGSMITSGLRRAVVWKGNASESSCNASPYYTMGNSNYGSEALAATSYNGHLFVVGIQYLSEMGDSYRGVLWKDGVEFVNFGPDFKPQGIDFHINGSGHVVGNYDDGSVEKILVFHGEYNDSSWESYSWNFPNGSHGYDLCTDDNMVYEVGYQGNQLQVRRFIEVLHSHTTSGSNNALCAVVVNPKGVYYAGQLNNQGRVWKDGSVLYSPSNCNYIYDMFIQDPTCTQTTYDLPFTEDFEYGSTHWPCWTHNYDTHKWERNGEGANGAGDIYVSVGTNTVEEAWLKSPKINIPAGSGTTTLSFESYVNENYSTFNPDMCKVMISTSSLPLPNTFHDVLWSPSSANGSWNWESVTVDLSAYNGQSIYLGFRAYGLGGCTWGIDNISITQSAPTQYTITANANNSSWGTVTGGGQYNAGATCTLQATPASGYQFDSWKKNGTVVSTNPNYSFTVTENATYTAYFSETPVTYYTITTQVTPAGAGTVTGGGTFPAGSSITLTATANNGYTFAYWQDGSTSNPRTITVNGNATYTATFTQDQYQITTSVSPAGAGTVTGGGAYHYGDQATLTATANSGYEFQGWNDGNTDNPRYVTVTGNAHFTAIFSEVGTTYYNVTATVSPAGAGYVTGTGTYEAGSVIVLTAIANNGYTFDHWNDNSTQNPRTVTVNGDMSFTAYFTQNQYIITVVANPPSGGTVGGGGAYHYGDYANLTATPFSGYEFVGWNDGSMENPHPVMVTGNATYTATFSQAGTTYYTVSAYVSPAGAGTVTGTGTYPAGATATLTATANSGYTFDHWNDGSTSNPRTVTVNNNMSFTAYFNTNQYTITVNANPTYGGTVSGGGTYAYGATAVLTATPASGYQFLQWQDGNTQNPRYVTVTGNATYTALFSNGSGTMYTLTVTGNTLLGQVYGSGTYPAGSSVEISAFPSPYARFVRWNDGNTDNPRIVVVNSNVTYTAEFVALQRYTLTVNSSNDNWGTAYGGGSYLEGSEVAISAVANPGYVFTGWNDGNAQNPRIVVVNSDATYTAQFSTGGVITHTLTVMCNTSEGTVSGGGTYVHGATAFVQAFPHQGYVFSKWDDGNTQNPRAVTVNSDMTLVAFFATGVDENPMANLKLYPNPAKSTLRIAGLEAETSVQIYNSLGELVKVVSVSADEEIDVRDLATGLYLVRCGKVALRFVKEQ